MAQNLHDILTTLTTGEETFLEVTGEPGDRKLTITSRQMLPEEITIRTPLYIDTSPLEIPLDLTIEADTSGISVVVSSGTIADARVAAFQDMIEIIDKVAKEKTFTMTFGRPKHRPWEYLKEQTPRTEE